MLKNILIFPSGTEAGLELYRSLKDSQHVRVFGANSTVAHSDFLYPQVKNDMPFVDAADFLPQLKAICAKHAIDFIFPAHDAVLAKLAQLEIEGNNELPPMVTSCAATNLICRSKRKTYAKLANIVPTAKEYKISELPEKIKFPLFLKPDVGQGSRGTVVVYTKAEAEFYCTQQSELMLLDYLSGPEYTIDCFTDRHGILRFVSGRQRQRVAGGISVQSVQVTHKVFQDYAEKINEALDFRGLWFFQLKENAAGDLVLLEVAPRVAGAMGFSRARGVNLPLLSVYDRMEMDIDIRPQQYSVIMDRALSARYKTNINYDYCYIDLDDTLLINNKVNLNLIQLIYKNLNNNKENILVTRHADNLNETLDKHGLTHLFTEVLWLKSGEKKSSYIKNKAAIFIDDSYAERREVEINASIPVFAPDMIEVLL